MSWEAFVGSTKEDGENRINKLKKEIEALNASKSQMATALHGAKYVWTACVICQPVRPSVSQSVSQGHPQFVFLGGGYWYGCGPDMPLVPGRGTAFR